VECQARGLFSRSFCTSAAYVLNLASSPKLHPHHQNNGSQNSVRNEERLDAPTLVVLRLLWQAFARQIRTPINHVSSRRPAAAPPTRPAGPHRRGCYRTGPGKPLHLLPEICGTVSLLGWELHELLHGSMFSSP
jgi:hypothetical protein